MKIGICLYTMDNPEPQPARRYAEIREMALRVEEAGFDSIWLADHLLYRFPALPAFGVWECWTVLAALAEATKRIELGSLVCCVPFRNPALLSKMAVTLDEVSGGRFTLGIGAGWNESEFTAFGVPFDNRVARFSEAIRIIAPLLKGSQVDFKGKYYRAEECEIRPRGPRLAGPPLLVGAYGRRMLKLAARYADIWNTGYLGDIGTLEARQALMRAACEEVGRNPSTLQVTVQLPVLFSDLGNPPPFFKELVSGTPEEIAGAWKRFEEKGVEHLMIEFAPYDATALTRLATVLQLYRGNSPTS